MKTILSSIILFFLFAGFPADAQNQQEEKRVKNDQHDLTNDVYVSYGFGSLYFIVNQNSDDNYNTAGSVIMGYSRSLGSVIAVGFQASFTNVTHTSSNYTYSSQTLTEYNDNYWSGMANIRFRYYNRPSFCMYSGAALGIAMVYKTETYMSDEKHYQKYLPAGQLTLLGFRVGRALSCYGEFGIGTNAIINAGISYKFGD